MKSTLVKKVYQFVWEKDSGRRAEITFMGREGKFILSDCDYSGVNLRYTRDDWAFMGALAVEVERLCVENESHHSLYDQASAMFIYDKDIAEFTINNSLRLVVELFEEEK